MFGIDSSEFLLIAVVALIVIGPKDLPRVMRLVGGWVGKGRAMTRHLRSGFDTMMREAELEEMQKQWAKQNAEIMAATAPAAVAPHAWDAAGAPHVADVSPSAAITDDPHAWAAPAHDALASPHAADAVIGDHVFDHPGALPVAEGSSLFADRHPRAGGDPGTQTFEVMGPRLRGDDNDGRDVAAGVTGDPAHTMTGPQPAAHSLARAADSTAPEPVITPEHAIPLKSATAQP